MALTNGILGSLNFNDGNWQGYEGDDFDAILDLGQVTGISQIHLDFLQDPIKWIFLPLNIEVSISEDGKNFEEIANLTHDIPQDTPDALKKEFTVNLQNRQARYIRIYAKSVGKCPEWHPGAGGKAWIFTDEIIVE